jgi:hypothetical protein
VSALAYPAQLRDLPTLRALTGAIERTAWDVQQLGRDASDQQEALRSAWTSAPADACTGHLGHVGRTLASSGRELDELTPAVRTYCRTLEDAEATYRQLVRELQSIPSAAEPDVVARIERSVRSRYDQLIQVLVAAERRVVEISSRIDQRLQMMVEGVTDGLKYTWLGAVLAGASTDGKRARQLMDDLRWVERSHGGRLPGAVGRYARLGHDFFDRLRVPIAAGPGNTPLSDLYDRFTSARRAPVLQYLFHDRIRASQRRMSPAALQHLGTAGRWGRRLGRGAGVVGTALTFASMPADYAANRDGYLAEGRSAASARALAVEDVAFKTGGEAVGGLAGAKAGAVVGAAIGSFFVPGVGTVIGAGIGAVAGGFAGGIAGGHIGEAAKDAFRGGRQAAGNAARSVGSAVSTAGRAVGDAASSAGRAVGDAASSVASGAKDVVGGLVRSIF